LDEARPARTLIDDFDALPDTFTITALSDGELVGACRITLPSADGLPTDGWFDFSSALPEGAIVGAGSRLCLDRRRRDEADIFLGLIGVAQMRLEAAGVTHLVGLYDPLVAPIFEWIGARRVGPDFTHDGLALPVTPLMIRIAPETLTPPRIRS